MKFLPHLITLLLLFDLSAQNNIRFQIAPEKTISSGNPVSIDISSFGINTNDTTYILSRLNKKEQISIPSQISNGSRTVLSFIADIQLEKGQKTEFLLAQSSNQPSPKTISLTKGKEGLQLTYNKKSILNYQFAETYPPSGVNPIYRKSGFIHPLWSPSGEVLTRIQAPDHYHHYGVWGPWTKTHINGRAVDFWNLGEGQGTVRFSKFLSEIEGHVFSGFSVLQEHVDFGAKGQDQVAINEQLEVLAWKIDQEGKTWMVDYTTTLNSPLDSGIFFDAYRYGGGIGMRATEKWKKDNCTVLTSEGNDRLSADGTEARWCIVEGESAAGRSGVLFMSHPGNKSYPEPMRIWPIDANGGRGDMFFEFCPIRHEDWQIDKGKNYTLKYRMVIFDGELTAEKAESYWQAFAYAPIATQL